MKPRFMQPGHSEAKFHYQHFGTFRLSIRIQNGNFILKTNLSGGVHSSKTLLLISGFRGNFFNWKYRIHPKVPKRWHQNFGSEIYGCNQKS